MDAAASKVAKVESFFNWTSTSSTKKKNDNTNSDSNENESLMNSSENKIVCELSLSENND